MERKKDENNEMVVIPERHSPVRHILNEANGLPNNQFIDSFKKAADTPDAYVIMEGDDGGQIYLSCPMKLVNCSEETLHTLLKDLDTIAWDCNEGEGRGLFYEKLFPGDGISGGMGGGDVEEGLWIHEEFIDLQLYDEIHEVILGNKERITKQ